MYNQFTISEPVQYIVLFYERKWPNFHTNMFYWCFIYFNSELSYITAQRAHTHLLNKQHLLFFYWTGISNNQYHWDNKLCTSISHCGHVHGVKHKTSHMSVCSSPCWNQWHLYIQKAVTQHSDEWLSISYSTTWAKPTTTIVQFLYFSIRRRIKFMFNWKSTFAMAKSRC